MNPKKQACDVCHKRKIHCDASDSPGSCNWCHHHGLKCTFSRERGRRKTKIAKSVKAKRSFDSIIAERIGRIEEALALKDGPRPANSSSSLSQAVAATGADALSASPSTAQLSDDASTGAYTSSHQPTRRDFPSPNLSIHGKSPSEPSLGQIHFAGTVFGQITSQSVIPHFSDEGRAWIRSRTGQNATFPALPLAPPFTLPASPSQHIAADSEADFLLSRSVVEQIMAEFFSSFFRFLFPIVDRHLFQDTVRIAFESWTDNNAVESVEAVSAKACVLAFLSIQSMYRGENGIRRFPVEHCHVHAKKAQILLSHVLEDASITNLQTCLMLLVHHVVGGRLQSAYMFHAIACRAVFTLGGHKLVEDQDSSDCHNTRSRANNHLRILFWVCYVFDKDLSLRSGQPPSLEDGYCDLTLPQGWHESLKSMLSLPFYDDSSNEKITPMFPGNLGLSIIKSKTFRMLYSNDAMKKSDADLLRDIRELDDELESWRITLPAEFRPALGMSKQQRLTELTETLNIHRVMVLLEYFFVLGMIHRATSRFSKTEECGVRSSMELSVEASRSTLHYLQAAANGLLGGAFWAILFYPIAALVTVFFNVLMEPLNPQAQLDLELLSSATDMLKRIIPTLRLTSMEQSHLRMVENFVAELYRLGKCAVNKVRAEESPLNALHVTAAARPEVCANGFMGLERGGYY